MQRQAMRPALRVFVAVLAFTGLAGVVPVSVAQVTGKEMCPHLGALPVCHVVTIAYAVMFVSVLRVKFWHITVFLTAWLPVFALAAAGSSLELAGYDTCPKTGSGWPKCFFSLTLACVVIAPVIAHWISTKRNFVS